MLAELLCLAIAAAFCAASIWSLDRADVWRRELARERERRIKAERDAADRMTLLLAQKEELDSARLDRDNARKLLGYRQSVMRAGMN